MNIQAATMDVPWFEAQTQYRAYRQLVKDVGRSMRMLEERWKWTRRSESATKTGAVDPNGGSEGTPSTREKGSV